MSFGSTKSQPFLADIFYIHRDLDCSVYYTITFHCYLIQSLEYLPRPSKIFKISIGIDVVDLKAIDFSCLVILTRNTFKP